MSHTFNTGIVNDIWHIFEIRAKNGSTVEIPGHDFGPGVGPEAIAAARPSADGTATDEPTVPDAPENFTATAGNGEVELSWQRPLSTGGSYITEYIITGINDEGGTFNYTYTVPVAGAPAIMTHTFTATDDIANDIWHIFEIRAKNGSDVVIPGHNFGPGVGPEAIAAAKPSAGTATNEPTVPGKPESFTAAPGNGQVTLSWQRPLSTGGSYITEYIITGISDTGVTFNYT